MDSVRGQLSWMAAGSHGRLLQPASRSPGAGYLLPPSNGRIVFRAPQSASDDPDASRCRTEDHRSNLAQLERLNRPAARRRCIPGSKAGPPGAVWHPTGCRSSARAPALDPSVHAGASRTDQVRFVAREPGLFLFHRARLARHHVVGVVRRSAGRGGQRRGDGRWKPACSMPSTRPVFAGAGVARARVAPQRHSCLRLRLGFGWARGGAPLGLLRRPESPGPASPNLAAGPSRGLFSFFSFLLFSFFSSPVPAGVFFE